MGINNRRIFQKRRRMVEFNLFTFTCLPFAILLPFIIPFKYIIGSFIVLVTILYSYAVKKSKEQYENSQKTLPKYDKVYDFQRPEREKDSVFHLLLQAAFDTPTYLKLVVNNYEFIDWTNFFVLKVLFVRLLISFLVTIVAAIEWAIYGTVVNNQKINERPLIVLGHFRSGTTLLHNLLARNKEDFHYMNSLPLIMPNGFLLFKDFEDKLSEILDKEDRWVDNIPYRFKDPQEDHIVIAQDTGIGHSLCIVFGRCYNKFKPWYSLEEVSETVRTTWKNSFIKLLKKLTFLQDKQVKKRILLKSPTHTAKVKLLLEVFPNAQFVYVHREPMRLFLSTAKLFEIFVLKNDVTNISNVELQDYILKQYNFFFKQYTATKELIPKGNLVELAYDDVSKDKLATMKKIYEGLKLNEWDKVKDLYKDFANNKEGYKKNTFVELDEDIKKIIKVECKEAIDYFGYQY